jgi:2-oxoglutarate ferredoxin oxidoreductase subunit beta
MHDGSTVHFRTLAEDYDPTSREAAYAYVRAAHARGEVATGLLYIDQGSPDMHGVNGSIEGALTNVPYEVLCPGNAKLQELMEEYR